MTYFSDVNHEYFQIETIKITIPFLKTIIVIFFIDPYHKNITNFRNTLKKHITVFFSIAKFTYSGCCIAERTSQSFLVYLYHRRDGRGSIMDVIMDMIYNPLLFHSGPRPWLVLILHRQLGQTCQISTMKIYREWRPCKTQSHPFRKLLGFVPSLAHKLIVPVFI